MSRKVLIVVGIIVILLLTGCITSDKSKKEPVVFSVLYNDREENPFQEDWLVLEEYEKRQNVVLDVRLGDDKEFGKVISQFLETENIPDIILKCWPETIENYANAGILLPFSDYENLMPNFMAYIKEHNLESELDKLRLKNEKYYILPGYQREIQVQQWIYRRDVFEKNSLEIPKTYDELFDSLVFLKKLYPETTPITACWNGAHLLAMMGAGYGITAGWAGTRYYNDEENRWIFSPATENYKELYIFLNRCYEAGILDPLIFTQSYTDYIEKLVNGSALVTVTWITSGFNNWDEKLKENGIPDGKWAAFPVPESTIGIKALPPVNRFRKGLIVPARTINETYFEDLLKFLDWAVYSEEGMTLTTWGVEGLTFKKTSDGKVFLPNIKTPKNAEGTIDISTKYGFDLLFNLNEDESFEDYKKPTEIVEFLNNSQNAKDTAKMNPLLKLSPNDIEAIGIINENILPYVDKSSLQFITGELSIEKNWNNYILELEKRGYGTLEIIWNNAWGKQNY